MNVLKAFYVDMIVPLQSNIEKDAKVVAQMQSLEEETGKLDGFCESSLEQVTSPAPSFSNCIAYWGQKDDWTAAIVGLAVGKACILARDTSYLVDHRNLVAAASRDAFVESANTLILRALGEGVLALLPDVNPDDCMVAHVIVVIVGVFIILEGEMRRLQLYRTCHPAPPAGYNRAKYAYRASIVSFVVMGGYGGGKAILSSPHGHGRRRRRDSMVGYSSWEEKRA
ncbi:hypothetical protein MTO96_021139 [Rhipicephalus appendiculatus]